MRLQQSPRVRHRVAVIAYTLFEYGATRAEALEAAKNIAFMASNGEAIEDAASQAISHRRRHFGLKLSDDVQCAAVICRKWWRALALESKEDADEEERRAA